MGDTKELEKPQTKFVIIWCRAVANFRDSFTAHIAICQFGCQLGLGFSVNVDEKSSEGTWHKILNS